MTAATSISLEAQALLVYLTRRGPTRLQTSYPETGVMTRDGKALQELVAAGLVKKVAAWEVVER